MIRRDFLRPKLLGERFLDHAIPLEVLKDLSVLEEFVVEVAKAFFLVDHPDRKRSPRGFTDGIQLKLRAIEPGSAVPVISLDVRNPSLFPHHDREYFERARDAIIDVVAGAAEGRSVSGVLPEKTLGYFDRLGRSLRAGEAIDLAPERLNGGARLTLEVRRQLLEQSGLRELTDEVTVRGLIPEADQDDMTFEIQRADGGKVVAPLLPEHHETVLRAFNEYGEGTRISVQGIGRFNRSGRLLKIESVEHVTSLDPLDVPARLEALSEMQDGWLDGFGKPPAKSGLMWLAEVFSLHFPDETPLPHVYPTSEGGIRFEWIAAFQDISLEINLERRTGFWHEIDLETGQDRSMDLNLATADGWTTVVNIISNFIKGEQGSGTASTSPN